MCHLRTVPLLLLAIAAVAVPGRAQDLTGLWNGEYTYPKESGRPPVSFRMAVVQAESQILGFIKEANTFGKEGSPWLHAVLKGRFDKETREVQFTKTYDGTAETAHDVEYRGLVTPDGAKAQGTWKIRDDWAANFTLERAAKPERERFVLAGLWEGAYHYPPDSGREPVKFWLLLVPASTQAAGFIKEVNTFGKDNEPWLHAVVKGGYEAKSRELSFTKTYDGTSATVHDVKYKGRVSSNADQVNGTWDIPEVWAGKFDARRVPPSRWNSLKLTVPKGLARPVELER